MKQYHRLYQTTMGYCVMLLFVLALSTNLAKDCSAQETTTLSGTVTYMGDPMCSMVLANGEYQFTCSGDGSFELTNVPFDTSGNITLFAFCNGKAPFMTILTDGVTGFNIELAQGEGQQPVVTITAAEESVSQPGWVDISGTLKSQGGIPLVAMVLINGEHMFTENPVGEFNLTVPIDSEGKILIYVFCSGFKPYRLYLGSSGLALKAQVDTGFDLYGDVTDLSVLLEDVIWLLGQLLANESYTPLTVTPPLDTINLDDLSSLPPTITAVLDYGTGYLSNSGATMSGKVTLELTNLVIDDTEISGDLSIVAEDLMRDGLLILDGQADIGGEISISDNGDLDITLTVSLINMETVVGVFNGDLELSTLGFSLMGDTLSPITLTLTDFGLGEDTVSGTFVFTMNDETTYTLDILMQTHLGDIDGVLVLTENPDGTYTLNNQGPASIFGYQVSVNDVVFDPATCEDYPVSGSMVFTLGDETYSLTFSDSCEGFVFE